MSVRPAADRDSAAWWARLAVHELVFQRCADCRRWRWPDRAICNACGSFAWRHEPASRGGEIASWIVNRHAFLPDLPAPYVVLNVRVDEQHDLVLPGAFAGAHDDPGLAIGARVRAGYRDLPGEPPAALLRWSLDPA